MDNVNLYTIIAVREPSLLEQQQGVGVVILAGPATLPATSSHTAAGQFGAQNADKLLKAPAGLLKLVVKEGM